MPIAVKHIIDRRIRVSFTYEGEAVNLVMWPVNGVPFGEVLDLAKQDGRDQADLIAASLVEWDLQGEDGKMFPITGENLRRLPFDFVQALSDACKEVTVPDPTKGSGSENGSSQTARSEPLPIGTRGSPALATSAVTSAPLSETPIAATGDISPSSASTRKPKRSIA